MGRMPLGTPPVCRVCNIALKIAFNWDVSRCRANSRICKDCNRNLNRKYVREHRERNLGHNREAWWRQRGIKLSYEEYTAKLEAQKALCAICCKKSQRTLVPDHDHATGQIRDLLCTSCNVAISHLESPFYSKYRKYLNKWRPKKC